jgi:DNA-binding transcriptional MerR regulator
MNIGEFASSLGVSTDTVRYYEKQQLLPPPQRQANGYRHYTPVHASTLRFVRSAQALGFSLGEIRAVLPALAEGRFNRVEMEAQLLAKLSQIDQHIATLRARKRELQATFASLQCAPDAPLGLAQATRAQPARRPLRRVGASLPVPRGSKSR